MSRHPFSHQAGPSLSFLLTLAIGFLLACGSDPVQPNPMQILSLSVDPDDTVILVNGSLQLTATVTDQNGNTVAQAVTWQSSAANTVTVSATGSITGVAEGSATVTAMSGNLSADALIVVAAEATFTADVQPIFTTNCALSGCHLNPNAQQGMDLSSGQSYANIVNVPSNESPLDRIEPGNPEMSYMVHKLRGTQNDVGGSGVQMPANGPPLPTATINILRAWVRGGALNN